MSYLDTPNESPLMKLAATASTQFLFPSLLGMRLFSFERKSKNRAYISIQPVHVRLVDAWVQGKILIETI